MPINKNRLNLLKLIFKKPRISHKGFIWDRFESFEKYEKYLRERLYKRIERDLTENKIEKAISRLEGFLERDTTNQEICNRAASLLLEINEPIRAGRYLYFKDIRNKDEDDAVTIFTKSLGNDPVLIARKMLSMSCRTHNLSEYQKEKYRELIAEIEKNNLKIPNFLFGLSNYLKKNNRH